MRAMVLGVLLASCSYPPKEGPRSLPTLLPDPPPATGEERSGLTELRDVAFRSGIALEVGRDDARLLAFHCSDDEPGPVSLRDPLRAHRACYRCVLSVVEQTPMDPYGGPPTDQDHALRVLAAAIGRYPDRFLAVASIDRLALCDGLVDETRADERPLSGLAEPAERRLLVRITDADAKRADAIIHHEVFHLFDWASSLYMVDPAWEALNPPGFHYDAHAEGELAGFLEPYAQTEAVEDKATVFQYLMSEPVEFCARAAVDPIILAKGRLIRDRIAAAAGDAAFVEARARCL